MTAPRSRMLYADARMELPAETAVLFGDDPTVETPAQAELLAAVTGADQLFVAGMVAPGPVLDIHVEAGGDLEQSVAELDAWVIGAMLRLCGES